MADVQGEFAKILKDHSDHLTDRAGQMLTLTNNVSQYIADGGQASEIAKHLADAFHCLDEAVDSLAAAIRLVGDN